ncbi:type I-F CRISPR-associated endonuclease Cas1f [Actinobacillus pleuropneumoniae]|uniref:Type I-F CRISPR-associated endonuclease Cas1f n=1 Tax=Actinobacillus pleuropneumoniae TaxID=715 RepID=A0A9Q4H4B8_ACTPL|nr:type I-F CRISPR-associated endonuclease Cas1f [Actinobacillus pleuropneumoniae]MCL7721087.1 type I-F CRISPR-associated endonuclease Cas1f [Actinobacillus pleuropneumoniae]MCL7727833.1 type I-F CRISPR-associated endonuclease Cas1f [Actinobacillus pleuropneumoniae]MCL7728616.1 type I-F CRISPR-associated endonuclease Cas1f [Actinobacillus pleuropneumoniae]MCY6367116.1 type I-F CRISPR-associated endonuclease Cas1f [Actinobacillus pleuropneumoniae]MCY6383982.1 type I-F CRISPR-associated endonucl
MKKTPYIPSSDLKTILHSKRANIYYLEHCRILLNGGRVEYVTDKGNESLYWNIPIANTICLLLGSGTSITQAAMRELSKAGVMVGFCSGGGTPLFNGTEAEIGCDFFSPQSEYRPVEYLQQWCRFWFDDNKRLNSAKTLQLARLQLLLRTWNKFDWEYAQDKLTALVQHYQEKFTNVKDSQSLLAAEGRLTAKLYALANQATLNDESFKRESGKEGANQFLDHGNYLAYGLGATACWVLGLPHGLAILHGKTRRGGLVFDAADIIKDAIILPQAFISAQNGDNEKQFRQACINNLVRFEALDIIINTLKQLASEGANI